MSPKTYNFVDFSPVTLSLLVSLSCPARNPKRPEGNLSFRHLSPRSLLLTVERGSGIETHRPEGGAGAGVGGVEKNPRRPSKKGNGLNVSKDQRGVEEGEEAELMQVKKLNNSPHLRAD